MNILNFQFSQGVNFELFQHLVIWFHFFIMSPQGPWQRLTPDELVDQEKAYMCEGILEIHYWNSRPRLRCLRCCVDQGTAYDTDGIASAKA